MGIWDNIADRQFAKDENGKLIFLPRGSRRPGYFVESSDESKFKSLVKVYVVAATIVNLTGSMASIAFAQALTYDERSVSLASKLRFGLVVYAISLVLLYIGPAVLLWSVYRGAVDRLCSSLTMVHPASVRLARLPADSRRTVLIVFAGFLILALGIFFAISYLCKNSCNI